MSYHTNTVARNLPRLGARSVGGLGAAPVTLSVSVAKTINGYVSSFQQKGATPDQLAYYRSCLTDTCARGAETFDAAPLCMADAKYVMSQLSPDGQAFFYGCMAQRSPDVPVRTQRGACFPQALQIPAGGGGGGGGGMVGPSAEASMMPASGGMSKWLWVGVGVAALGVGYLVLRK